MFLKRRKTTEDVAIKMLKTCLVKKFNKYNSYKKQSQNV